MESKIEKLKEQKEIIEKQIKRIERRIAQRGLFKKAKEVIGSCYVFRNGYSNTVENWNIYAIVKDVKLEDSSVYIILDKYEKTTDNEIIVRLNSKELQGTYPMHCWNSISKELFEENKQEILKLLKTKEDGK